MCTSKQCSLSFSVVCTSNIATTVDLTSTHYQILENAVTVQVCAVVQSEGTPCPIETNYTLHLSTMDGTAGNFSLAIFFSAGLLANLLQLPLSITGLQRCC